jgi:hypothetical protein
MFTGIGAVVAGFFGSSVGLLQGVIDKKQETRRFEIEKQFDNERIKIENNTTIEVAKSGIDIEKYKSIISTQEANKTKYEQEKQEYSDFTDAVVDLTKVDIVGNGKLDKFARFITASVRPVITYIFVIGVIILSFKASDKDLFLELFFIQLDFILGFWFVRRSYDKNQISNIFQKKKT